MLKTDGIYGKRDAMRRARRSHGRHLKWVFTGLVFATLLLSSLLLGGVIFLLYKIGVLDRYFHPNPLAPLIYLLVVSLLVGTFLSLIIGGIPLRPIRRIIDAVNALAAGDFSVRLNLKGPEEFIELNESFNRMAQELGGLEILRTDFINDFSHEFKTPIVSMRGFAKLLRHGDLTEEERIEYLDIIIEESNRLARLSGNVLLLSRLENQHIVANAARFQLDEQIRQAILLLEPKWGKRGIEMDVQLEPCRLDGNEELLKQVWINLVDNAVKFSPDGGTVRVALEAKPDAVTVRISDEGPGMDEETRSRMFERFYQGDRSRALAGNGLGLTIAMKIVQLHRGEIGVESRPGHGTRMTVSLPAAEPELPAAAHRNLT